MCCAVAKNVKTLYALRFLIGLAESSAYPGMLWVLGSWYGPTELSKRTVLFICCSSAGTMFSGYLQAAVYNNLDGVSGRAGWQWLFLMDGVISLCVLLLFFLRYRSRLTLIFASKLHHHRPIAALGFFLIPNTPDRPNPRSPKLWLREQDIVMGQERAVRFKRAPTKGFTAKDMLEAFKNWVPWTFMVPYTCFVVGLVFFWECGIVFLTRNSIRIDRLNSYAYMSLWLKAEKYTVDQINLIPTGGYALQIFMALIVRTLSTLRFFSFSFKSFANSTPGSPTLSDCAGQLSSSQPSSH